MPGTNVSVLFLWQNARVINISISHDFLICFLSFNKSRSSFNLNLNVVFVTSYVCLGLSQFQCTTAQRLRFLQDMILRAFLLINFNIITRNHCFNKTI